MAKEEEKKEEKKIIIDEDWKQEAQKEKEVADRKAREAEELHELPDPSLAEIVQMIAIQATLGLGGMQDPQTGQRIPAQLPLAKHYIDLLELLQQKTTGQLDEQDKQLIEGTLHELRMAFVQVAGVGPGSAPQDQPPSQ